MNTFKESKNYAVMDDYYYYSVNDNDCIKQSATAVYMDYSRAQSLCKRLICKNGLWKKSLVTIIQRLESYKSPKEYEIVYH